MKKKELLNIGYNFYPKSIDSIKNTSQYVLSREYKRLINEIIINKEPYSKEVIDFITKIKEICHEGFIFNDTNNFEWQDRCYTFEFNKQIDSGFLNIKFYKSILGPFFTIKCYEIKVNENKYFYIPLSSKKFPYLNFIVKLKQLSKKNKLLEIDFRLLDKKIDDINFQDIQMGEFTIFNVFFN